MRKVKEKRARFKTPLGTHTNTHTCTYMSICLSVRACVDGRPCCNPLNNALPAQPSPVQFRVATRYSLCVCV